MGFRKNDLSSYDEDEDGESVSVDFDDDEDGKSVSVDFDNDDKGGISGDNYGYGNKIDDDRMKSSSVSGRSKGMTVIQTPLAM